LPGEILLWNLNGLMWQVLGFIASSKRLIDSFYSLAWVDEWKVLFIGCGRKVWSIQKKEDRKMLTYLEYNQQWWYQIVFYCIFPHNVTRVSNYQTIWLKLLYLFFILTFLVHHGTWLSTKIKIQHRLRQCWWATNTFLRVPP